MYRSNSSHSLYSVFTSKFAAAVLILLMISSAAVAGDPLQAQPGEVLVLDHAGEEGLLHMVALFSPDGGEIDRFQSFPLQGGSGPGPGKSDRNLQRVLVPLSSTISEGTYGLSFFTREGALLKEREVEITGRSFRHETIPLGYSLTELRSSKDPKKYQESIKIQEIYASFNPQKALGSLSLHYPLPPKESGSYRVTSEYGDRRIYSYSDESTARSIHSGIDLAAPIGTPVLAVEAGQIVLAADRIISGNSVVIEHLPGVYSIYFHLDGLEVEQGNRVQAGQQIGTVGMSGLATGPHLHYEVRVNGVAVDPVRLSTVDPAGR
ncbi:MAG: M23 family metallopeptidase [Spirochaetaceae bacterium]|nr:M23 family metallopeptidase [Spirochaetaceae bacterium]MCF7948246.1 M23 family metallopeptidase [Spirochaetia bacterium]MCF7950939.1 M23 family metallopeptidase [Spirochaetaceae bacterium]